jgi:hypothetical protein
MRPRNCCTSILGSRPFIRRTRNEAGSAAISVSVSDFAGLMIDFANPRIKNDPEGHNAFNPRSLWRGVEPFVQSLNVELRQHLSLIATLLMGLAGSVIGGGPCSRLRYSTAVRPCGSVSASRYRPSSSSRKEARSGLSGVQPILDVMRTM